MCTALDLAKQRNNQPIVDYLVRQKSAQMANEIPADILKNERANIEKNLKSGLIYLKNNSYLF
jgi:hypothetical protein